MNENNSIKSVFVGIVLVSCSCLILFDILDQIQFWFVVLKVIAALLGRAAWQDLSYLLKVFAVLLKTSNEDLLLLHGPLIRAWVRCASTCLATVATHRHQSRVRIIFGLFSHGCRCWRHTLFHGVLLVVIHRKDDGSLWEVWSVVKSVIHHRCFALLHYSTSWRERYRAWLSRLLVLMLRRSRNRQELMLLTLRH